VHFLDPRGAFEAWRGPGGNPLLSHEGARTVHVLVKRVLKCARDPMTKNDGGVAAQSTELASSVAAAGGLAAAAEAKASIGPPPAPAGSYVMAAPAATMPAAKLEAPPGCCLFVYHIPISWTDEDLATAFSPFEPPGKLTSATVFKDKATNVSKGFGFVNYDNPTSANNAITAMHGMQVEGKRLKVEVKKPRGAQAAAGPGVAQDPIMALAMQQLAMQWGMASAAPQMGMDPMQAMMQQAQTQAMAQMQAQMQPAAQPAYDYSQYAQPYSNAVYQDPGMMGLMDQSGMAGLGGMSAMPSWPAQAQQQPAAASAAAWPPQAMASMPMQMPVMDPMTMAAYGLQTLTQQTQISKPKREPPPNSTLFIYHLPITWTDHDLEQCFLPFAAPGQLLHALVYKDKATGASKGFGFVSFDNPQSAQTAIQGMHGMSIDSGKRLRVELKKPRGERFTPYG
jgi:CUG-BP- and ETR3-like factor